MNGFKVHFLVVLTLVAVNVSHAATRWTPKSSSDSENSISIFFAPSHEIEIEFDASSTKDLKMDFYGVGAEFGPFYAAGAIASSWGDGLSDESGFGLQAGFRKELYCSDPLSLDFDVKGLYFDFSSDEFDAKYNELTAGVMLKYTLDELVFFGGFDIVLHSDCELEDNDRPSYRPYYYDEDYGDYEGEADSRINFILGAGYHIDIFFVDLSIGLFGYEGLMLSGGVKF